MTLTHQRGAPRPPQLISSVDKALTLLQMVGEHESVRISDASKVLGVAPSTASRLMSMLEYHEFATQDPQTKAYGPGPRLAEVAFTAMRRIDGHRNIRHHLERLVLATGETAHYLILRGGDAVFLDGIEGSRPVKTTLRLGSRRPAHCVSGGKAILATLDSGELDLLYPKGRLHRCTDKTIVTRSALDEDLQAIRNRSYATSIQESEPDIAGVAVAILGGRGRALGAFAISMPISRYHPSEMEFVLGPLRAAALAAESGT